jgi:predicted ATPase
MRFKVVSGGWPTTDVPNRAFLTLSSWDDWFRFQTRFNLWYVDDDLQLIDIGGVKIGQFGMDGRGRDAESKLLPRTVGDGERIPAVPKNFQSLGEDFFSLGQSPDYYETLNTLGTRGAEIRAALRDIVTDNQLYDRALEEDVTGVSLMRSVPSATIEGQFRRIVAGGKRLESFSFAYHYPQSPAGVAAELTFSVEPGSYPPTNVHAIIGRNGVGKTFLLENLSRCLVVEDPDADAVGDVVVTSSLKFANLVSVTFSAFDSFQPLATKRNRASGLTYTYIGLKRTSSKAGTTPLPPKAPQTLAKEFGASVRACALDERVESWRKALQTLATDPIFKSAGVDELLNSRDEELFEQARTLFRNLSSGHKIVLLTVTRLVEVVEERSLVLIDEPEAHLHPPLLAAFVRALSDLLIDRNGVAVVTTHSPVVLQEVPMSCAWIVSRHGRNVTTRRPDIETFGENVGILTHQVFGLEVTRSGFHHMLYTEAERLGSWDALLERFGGQLGSEAAAIARSILLTKSLEED